MASSETSDVSAIVLSVGERTTQLAIDSIERQSLRPHEIIIVRDVTPFHKAMNTGAAQVRTPFFVQVDADMILDPHCLAALRSGMRPHIGIVVAWLRDALVGQVVGIKLFRTECFRAAAFPDSISPDTDFVGAIGLAGWKTKYIGHSGDSGRDQWDCFGEHRPAYTLAYSYRKHLLEGSRYHYRRSVNGFRWRLGRLEASSHPSSLIAQIGLARGLFLEGTRDLLGSGWIEESFSRLEPFLHVRPGVTPRPAGARGDDTLRERFHASYRAGSALFASGDSTEFRRLMTEFDDRGGSDAHWVSKVALCQGLLAETKDDDAIEGEYFCVRQLLGTDHEAIAKYASEEKLDRFVVTGSAAAEYRVSQSDQGRVYKSTSRAVVATADRRGRPRISIPFKLFGHVACVEPEKLSGMFWCLDLLRSGHMYVHVPTSWGPKRVSVLGQLMKNCTDRAALSRVLPSSLDRAIRSLSRHRDPRYRPIAGRILMIVTTFILGGAERQMAATAIGLVDRGYDVRLIAMNPLDEGTPGVEDELSRLGILTGLSSDYPISEGKGWARAQPGAMSATSLAELPPWLGAKIGAVGLAIQFHRPAVVHTWLDGGAVIGGLAACALGVPRIVLEQASLSIRHHLNQAVEYLLSGYRCVARNESVVIINNSFAGASDYEQWLGIRNGKIRVVYNGFVPATLRTPTNDEIVQFRAALGLPAGVPIVGSLIRFVEDKDPTLWLDTAAEIARSQPEVRFLLAGYGPLRGAIVDRAKALGLGDRLVLPGAIADVGLVYALLDVVLLTSRVEGVPNLLVEAQSAGCPIVSADVGGVREAVIDGRTARIVRQRSSRSLAEAVLAILADPDWRTRLRTEGPAFVAARFGIHRMIDEKLEAYGLPERPPEPCRRPAATKPSALP
jgi:glycosyltransferase involved in cell wall biosynthesis